MLFVLLSKRFLRMTVLDGFAFVAIRANLLDCYSGVPNTSSLKLMKQFTVHFFCQWERIVLSAGALQKA